MRKGSSSGEVGAAELGWLEVPNPVYLFVNFICLAKNHFDVRSFDF